MVVRSVLRFPWCGLQDKLARLRRTKRPKTRKAGSPWRFMIWLELVIGTRIRSVLVASPGPLLGNSGSGRLHCARRRNHVKIG